MSHGKFAKMQTELSLLDRLNNRLARLMGKKDPQTPLKNNVPSNGKFVIIIFVMLLSLWVLTGVYYVQEKSYGLVLQQGRVTKVLNGLHIGVTWPYPFAEVVILDSNDSAISLGKNSEGNSLSILSADNQQLVLSAEANYQISNPQYYFINYHQQNINLDQRVNWLIMAMIQDYMLHHSPEWLLHTSSIVISNEIRQLSDKVLANYGLKLTRFSLKSLQKVGSTASNPGSKAAEESQPLVTLLLNEASQYRNDKQFQTESMIREFNQLLPQYRANPQAIVELMYYKMLSLIPTESANVNRYPLLKLTMPELLQLQQSPYKAVRKGEVVANSSAADIRAVNRSVDRQRLFKDR